MPLAIVFTDPMEGGVSIHYPNPALKLAGESDQDFAARMAAVNLPGIAGVDFIDHANIPKDRYFRMAWKRQNGGL